jgi:DNA-directed RNA polymerase, mitochondrial
MILPDSDDANISEDALKAAIEEGNAALNLELGMGADDGVEWDDDEYYTVNEGGSSSSSIGSSLQTEAESRQSLQKSAMQILRNFDPQMPPSTNDLEELQLWLECAAQREAVLRYQNMVKKARDRKAYDSMSLMQRHLIKWFEGMRDAVEVRQKDYLSNKDTRRGRKRYGPFLCSLPPEKMAVIASHEAMTQALLFSGKTGRDGVPLIKIAHAIGTAIETEVISQRRMKERFHDTRVSTDNEDAESDGDDMDEPSKEGEKDKSPAADRWKFSASHLKLFIAELQRIDPKMGKSKRSISYAMQRAKQAMNSEEGWTTDDVIHLGAAMLSILVENCTINNKGREEPAFRVETKWTPKKKTTSFVVMNENIYRMFTEDELLSWAASTTRHTPMIVPPTEWTGPQEGGYRWLEADLMRTHGSRVQREALQHGDLSLVYDGLNILGKTAWKINKKILEIAQTCWDESIPIGDIPSRTDLEVPPEPPRPDRISPELYADKERPEAKEAFAANQSFRESMHKRQRTLQKNMDLRSLRCSAALKLNQAKQFKDFEKIYFPYNLDFRGRACK